MTDTNIYDWEEKKVDTTYSDHVIAGCIAGIAEHLCMLPFDNIKVISINNNNN
jgi:hypothetical protein